MTKIQTTRYDVAEHLAQTGEWAPPFGYRPPGLDDQAPPSG